MTTADLLACAQVPMLTGDVDLVIRAAQGAAPYPVPLHLLPLKRLPIPLPEFGGRFIGFLKKAQEELRRATDEPHRKAG